MLLDIEADGSLSLPEKAKAVLPSLRIIGYAVSEIGSGILACARSGMCGYIGKDACINDLVDAALRAMKGELACSPRVTALLFSGLAAGPRTSIRDGKPASLTSREMEIALLVADGLANKEIARKLRLGNPTVKNHVHNILSKLNVARRSQIAPLLRLHDLSMRPPVEDASSQLFWVDGAGLESRTGNCASDTGIDLVGRDEPC
jgi:DNA-binding NarL/FixJ family response regulator